MLTIRPSAKRPDCSKVMVRHGKIKKELTLIEQQHAEVLLFDLS
ncbi:hypothetical protein [Pelovirga terrestris]|nr:hypothetical protein [Pelovirga terrestris]